MCDCITRINKFLKDHNTQLEAPITFNPDNGMKVLTIMRIATVKINNRKKLGPVGFFATYCPVCGEKYEQ